MAAGTVAGAISDSFDASASLEIFSMDLGSKSGQMELLGSIQTDERFHKLAWGTHGTDSGSLPYGMLAGGLVDGTVKVYNPMLMARWARGEDLACLSLPCGAPAHVHLEAHHARTDPTPTPAPARDACTSTPLPLPRP